MFKVSATAFAQVGFSSKTIECKESRIGKQPIAVPSNVTIALEGQDLKVKGPLGELALTYPREVELTTEDSGFLRVKKTVETRRANQMHGLFRFAKLSPFGTIAFLHIVEVYKSLKLLRSDFACMGFLGRLRITWLWEYQRGLRRSLY